MSLQEIADAVTAFAKPVMEIMAWGIGLMSLILLLILSGRLLWKTFQGMRNR